MAYSTNQAVLRRMTVRTRGMSGFGDATGSTVGAAAGTAIAPGIGTAIGSFIGGLFGGKPAPQNPGGPTAFARWASEGHFDWVASVALNRSGPNWQQDPGDTGQPWKTGYSPADAASAQQILAQYGMTPATAINRGSTSATVVIPGNPAIGIPGPVTVTVPGSATRTGAVTGIPAEVTQVLTYVAQGQTLAQAIQTAIVNGQLAQADAAAVSALAGQAKSGTTTTTYTAGLAALASNPLVLVGGLALVLLLSKRGRR